MCLPYDSLSNEQTIKTGSCISFPKDSSNEYMIFRYQSKFESGFFLFLILKVNEIINSGRNVVLYEISIGTKSKIDGKITREIFEHFDMDRLEIPNYIKYNNRKIEIKNSILRKFDLEKIDDKIPIISPDASKILYEIILQKDSISREIKISHFKLIDNSMNRFKTTQPRSSKDINLLSAKKINKDSDAETIEKEINEKSQNYDDDLNLAQEIEKNEISNDEKEIIEKTPIINYEESDSRSKEINDNDSEDNVSINLAKVSSEIEENIEDINGNFSPYLTKDDNNKINIKKNQNNIDSLSKLSGDFNSNEKQDIENERSFDIKDTVEKGTQDSGNLFDSGKSEQIKTNFNIKSIIFERKPIEILIISFFSIILILLFLTYFLRRKKDINEVILDLQEIAET